MVLEDFRYGGDDQIITAKNSMSTPPNTQGSSAVGLSRVCTVRYR